MEGEGSVIVVGAGIGGLVLARALSQLGTSVELVERAPNLGSVGAGITLGANAMRILAQLGLADEVARQGLEVSGGTITDVRGRVLSDANLDQVEARYGKTIAIERSSLHQILKEGLFEGDGATGRVHLGTTVERVEELSSSVRVELTSGQSLSGRALIGADGIRSRVRELVFGKLEPSYSGYTCWRFTGRVPGGGAGATEMWGAGKRVGFVPLRSEGVYAFFVESAPRNTPRDPERRRVSYVREQFGGFAGLVPRILEALGDNRAELLHHDIEEVRVGSWVRGRTALLGDAAHAMTPNLGQGAAMAIEDALVLSRELTSHASAKAGLIAYEGRRRPRALDIQNRSRALGKVAQLRSPMAVWARNWALRNAPRSAAQKTVERIVAYVP
jgi:2-polyprenyl-6-methoxyphenol hydroxylase-like FAD-dependent oxidoreductase